MKLFFLVQGSIKIFSYSASSLSLLFFILIDWRLLGWKLCSGTKINDHSYVKIFTVKGNSFLNNWFSLRREELNSYSLPRSEAERFGINWTILRKRLWCELFNYLHDLQPLNKCHDVLRMFLLTFISFSCFHLDSIYPDIHTHKRPINKMKSNNSIRLRQSKRDEKVCFCCANSRAYKFGLEWKEIDMGRTRGYDDSGGKAAI